MAGYQRMVSYLYEYKRGEKGANVGYARLEIRENMAKMIISVRMRRDVSAVCPVELYYWEGKSARRIEVGQITLSGGRVEDRVLLPGKGEKNGVDISLINGLMICLPDGVIGSAWDEQPVPAEQSVQSVQREERYIEMSEEEETSLQAAEVMEEPSETSLSQPESQQPRVPDGPEDDTEPRPGVRPGTEEQTLAYFFENGTRMCPFEDATITQCVRIEPADLEYLPREAWVLGSNSFLLHGYYTYGHLILAKLKGMGVESTILGVPGQYQNRERFLAKMFGFEYFKPIGASSDEGDFGYWYLFLPETVQ